MNNTYVFTVCHVPLLLLTTEYVPQSCTVGDISAGTLHDGLTFDLTFAGTLHDDEEF
jgi:hypothetical protein